MLSVGAIRFEDSFCPSRKGGIGGGGRAHSRHAMHMAAALAGCRTALVGTGSTISHLVSTNRCKNHSSSHVGPEGRGLITSFTAVCCSIECRINHNTVFCHMSPGNFFYSSLLLNRAWDQSQHSILPHES